MQPHTLASGGLQAMEALLPGFHREVRLAPLLGTLWVLPACTACVPAAPNRMVQAAVTRHRSSPPLRSGRPLPSQLVRRGGVELDLCRDFRFFDFDSTYARAEESSLKVRCSDGG